MDKFLKWNGPKSLPISSLCDVKSTIAPLYLQEHASCHLDALLPPIHELLKIPTKIGISNTTVDVECINTGTIQFCMFIYRFRSMSH